MLKLLRFLTAVASVLIATLLLGLAIPYGLPWWLAAITAYVWAIVTCLTVLD